MTIFSPKSKHELLCSEEDLQFYALNMLHDLAHDYMEDIHLDERSVTEGGPEGPGGREAQIVCDKKGNMSSGCIPTQSPHLTEKEKKEEKNELIIDIIKYFKPRILDNETPQNGLIKNQNDTLDTIIEINSKTTDCDTIMLNKVVESMTGGVIEETSPYDVGTPGTTLQNDIDELHKNECDYLIDNAKNDIPVHNLKNHTFCPISSSMDGKAQPDDVCKDFPNASKLTDLAPHKKTEKGNMLIKLYTTNKNYIVLKRNHDGDIMHLTAEFKFGTFHFKSTMSIMSLSNTYRIFKPSNQVHSIEYIIKINNQNIKKTIKFLELENYVTDINLTSNNIYKKALKNIEKEEGDNRIIIAYGTLIFKSFGDILQEWNGVLKEGGYHGPITYDNKSSVCRYYLDSENLRVILSKDKLSGARILWSLFKGKEEWEDNINKNCFGGYVNKHQYGDDYKIYNPGKNTLYKYGVPNNATTIVQPSSPGKRKTPSEGNDDGFGRTKSPKTLNEGEESTKTYEEWTTVDRSKGNRASKKTTAVTGIATDTDTATTTDRGRGGRGRGRGRGGRGRGGRGRGRGATGGASTIQQETYQDPLTYAIVAIGAFAAMMIGLQK
jgi:hypothetical protein